jgi:hypothetical protein
MTRRDTIQLLVGAVVGLVAAVVPCVVYVWRVESGVEPFDSFLRFALGSVLLIGGAVMLVISAPRVVDPGIALHRSSALERGQNIVIGTLPDDEAVSPRVTWIKSAALGLAAWALGHAVLFL